MFSTRYVLIWPKGRSVVCGKAAGGSHLNSLPENEEMRCRHLEPMVKSGRTISHIFSFFVKKNRTVCFFGLWSSKNLSAGDFQELHLTGRALRSLESHKVLLCTQQVVSIEAGSVGPCFYFGSWSGCWLFLRECFLLTFFVQTVVFPFVFFENTFRSLGRCLPVFCLYVYLLAAAFLWEWSGLAPESFIFSFDCSSFELSFHEPDHPVSRAGRHGDSAYAVVGAAKGLPSWHHGQKQRVWVESWFVLAISVSAI